MKSIIKIIFWYIASIQKLFKIAIKIIANKNFFQDFVQYSLSLFPCFFANILTTDYYSIFRLGARIIKLTFTTFLFSPCKSMMVCLQYLNQFMKFRVSFFCMARNKFCISLWRFLLLYLNQHQFVGHHKHAQKNVHAEIPYFVTHFLHQN